jgi:hypothetical protein
VLKWQWPKGRMLTTRRFELAAFRLLESLHFLIVHEVTTLNCFASRTCIYVKGEIRFAIHSS